MKSYNDGALVSVVIPNWNGKSLLETCLPSLEKLNFEDFEVIVVDNGSEDDSVAYIEENFPEIHIIKFPENRGFAPAVNAGIFASTAKYVALLNNDTEAHPDWLNEGVRALEEQPTVGFIACKMLDYWQRDIINGAGDNYIKSGNAYKRGFGKKDSTQYNCEKWVFGACAGAAIYRRKIFDEIGGFDDDFFAYVEDVDWSFRAQIMGYSCLYVPTSIIYHMEGISSAKEGMDPLAKYRNTLELESPRKTFWIARNKFYVIIKNMPLLLILKYLPEIIKDGILTSGLAHLIHTGYWRNFLAGLFAVLWNFPKFLKKRWQIQKKRKLSVKEIDSLIQACELERRRGFLAMCLPRSKIETDALISVILSHHGDDVQLNRCMESVANQDYEKYEIILVKNKGNDVAESVKIASDMDEAIEKARGTFVAVIDSEVIIQENWLSEMCETALSDEQAGMIGCKILEAKRSLDSDASQTETPKIQTIGWQICRNGTVHLLGNGEEDFRQHDALRQIFAPSRQAALFSMEMLNETRAFDDRLNQCAQTIDLGWRGRLMGWKALLSPGAVAISSQNKCNPSLYDKCVIVLKNWTFLLILKHFWRLTFSGIWKPLFTRKGLKELPEILSKRRKIQNSRMIPKIEIEEWFKLL